MKKFKEEVLILYIYQDCSPKMQAAIEAALAEEDIELKDRLLVLRRTIRQLDKLKLNVPSKQSIKTIIKYAEDTTRKK